MKYAVIIAGGGGESVEPPIPELDGFTPLEAAPTPSLDALGQIGRQGVVSVIAEDESPAAHAPVGALLGCDMSAWSPSCAAMEAAGLAAPLSLRAAAWRLAPVTLDADFACIADPFPPGLAPADTRALVDALLAALNGHPDLSGFRLLSGAGPLATSGVLILDDAPDEAVAGRCALPGVDAIVGRPLLRALRKGEIGQRLRALCELSADVFQSHPVNSIRAEHGLAPISMFWPESGGGIVASGVPSFEERHGVRAAMITGDAAGAGTAHLLGIDRLPVPGDLVGVHADLGVMASHAIEALDRYDLVIIHTDAMTGASLAGDWRAKTALWQRIDEELVLPLRARLLAEGDAEATPDAPGWRLMVAAGSVCSTARRARTAEAAPFVMAGAFVRSVLCAPFGDTEARRGDLKINPGHTLMEYFLYSGLRAARRRPGVTIETRHREN